MSNTIAGLYQIQMNGKELPLKSEPSFSLGGNVAEEVEVCVDRCALSEKPMKPYIEGSFANFADVKMEEIQAVRGARVILVDPNGRSYVFRGVSQVGQVVNDGQGSISFRFVGEGKASPI